PRRREGRLASREPARRRLAARRLRARGLRCDRHGGARVPAAPARDQPRQPSDPEPARSLAVPTFEAERELLAPRADVRAFLAEPYNLPDWWPGVGGLQPDRRGLAPGARWQIVGENRPSLFRKPNMSGTLLVLAVEPYERFAFQLTGERLEAELRLSAPDPDRTLAHLTV